MTTMRTAVHVHSEWSYDASWSLEDLATAFVDRNYRAVLMTEHDRGFDQARWDEYRKACGAASRPDFLFVPGIEYSDADNRVHTLVWGEDLPFLGEALPTLSTLERVTQEGGVAVMAHPWRRSAWQLFEDSWAPHLIGIELWNRKSDGWAPSAPGVELLDRHGLWPVASLDFHRARQFFPLAMNLETSGEPTVGTVIDAMRSKRGCAEAFGRPAEQFRKGLPGGAARMAEKGRRVIAPVVRLLVGRG